MKKIIGEFKEFISKGNVMDLAVGVIIGAAFQSVIKSLTDDIISPLIGLIANKDFSDLVLDIFGVSIRYGAFITSVLNFFLMAIVIFLLVKGMNAFRRKKTEPEEEAKPMQTCPYCKSEIDAEATRCPACTSKLDSGEALAGE